MLILIISDGKTCLYQIFTGTWLDVILLIVTAFKIIRAVMKRRFDPS